MTALQLATVAISSAAIMLTRVLPFLVFSPERGVPSVVRYLGKVLPSAIFGLLVVYCLRETDLAGAWHGLPEAIGVLSAAGLYVLRRDMLLAVFGSTALYMLLVNWVFA